MNEEEKKSIEILKERKRDLLGISNSSFYSCDRKLYKERVEAIDTILNLIDKQQKEIKARSEEIDSLYKMISTKDEIIENLKEIVNKYTREIEELKEDNNALEMMIDTANAREYRKKYIEERRKEQPNLYYPDFDEIYERYYKQKAEIEQLKEDYQILKDDIEEHNIVYVDTPEFEEKYISKDKIKEKIQEIETLSMLDFVEKEKFDFKYTLDGIYCMQKGVVFILKELLGE